MDRSLNAGRWQLRALVYASCLLTILSLLVLKGGARVAAAPVGNSNPSFEKLLSIGQAPSFRVAESPLSSFNFAASDDNKITPNTPYTITLSATPPSGSAIGQGQIITYTITITNGATADTTAGNGFIRSFSTSTVDTAFQFNPAFPTGVKTQPAAGSAWGPCTITPNGNGTNQFTCYAGDTIVSVGMY